MSRRLLVTVLGALMVLLAGGGVLRHALREHEGPCGDADAEAEHAHVARDATSGMYTGPSLELDCIRGPHPESFGDLARANSSRLSQEVAPGTALRPGAYRASLRARAALTATGGTWSAYGHTPLVSYRGQYDTTAGSTHEGLGDLSGRASSFARDGAGNLYVGVSNGGVWKSTNGGTSWKSIGDNLPTQVVSSVAWTSAGGGTLVVLTGDNAYGGDTYAGQGVYRSTDGGRTWHHAAGVADGLLGFKLAVDPTHPGTVYAATGGGLFRSTDAGATFTNENLPTGSCAGKSPDVKNCFLANMVTDVVVQAAGGPGSPKPGAVMAAVGWRAGDKHNAAGAPQSPGNGMYTSRTGAPGSFAKAAIPTSSQSELGRIALGIANGAKQDHNVVYAMVQDANKFNGGAPVIDVNDQPSGSVPYPEVFNGLYVTTDFGAHWKELASSDQLKDPTTNSALDPACEAPVIAYCPGVQAWYNLWVQPDPTQQTAAGIPKRLAFGLEEVWASDPTLTPPTGLDGSTPARFDVVGRYYGGDVCTIINASNVLPVCPTAQGGQVPKWTTHPDQHAGLWVPDGSGGVTLLAANDGGVYRQHVAKGGRLSNDNWGKGSGPSGDNAGLNTLQPYDFGIARDGTLYMGLQDNGEAKIDPDGTAYTIYGGDGFFSSVDPDHPNTAYEEYTAGDISVTQDGGKTWTDIQPTGLTDAQFATPFEQDARDANHLVLGGRQVFETTDGPATTSDTWSQVYDLGTQQHPGDASASATSTDPANQLSAVDTTSETTPSGAPTGTKTASQSYTGGGSTVPGGGDQTGLGVFVPGSYEDHTVTIGPSDGDAAMDVDVTWADSGNDWDLYVYRKGSDGSLTLVGTSANGGTTAEHVRVANPAAGEYVVRVVNFAATGTYAAKVTFEQRRPGGGDPDSVATYVGFCGFCDTVTQGTPFHNGLATDVGGSQPGRAGTGDGWHIAAAHGLPNRYITSVRMDPADPRTVYVTEAGYGRRWAFPGALGEATPNVGTGHVFKSTDAGQTFADVTGNLPDTPANWTVLHHGHLIVGTDIGVFESCDSAGGAYRVLGHGLPTAPVSVLRFKPGSPDDLYVATYGRGIYHYRFGADNTRCPAAAGAPGTAPRCTSIKGFRSVRVRPAGHGLRFRVERRLERRFTITVWQRSAGRTTFAGQRKARFTHRRRGLTWHGRRGTPGLYTAVLSMRAGRRSDIRRFVFSRDAHRRFHRRPTYFARQTCHLLRLARLASPAFGGGRHAPLRIRYRTARPATLTATVRRHGHRVRRWRRHVHDTRPHTLRLRAGRVRAGDVRVKLVARAGRRHQTIRLTARRLR